MPECWLKPNLRAIRLAMIVPAMIVLLGVLIAIVGSARGLSSPIFLVGTALILAGGVALVGLWWAARIPRVAYESGELLVYLRSLTPLRVPVDVVECFFLGQGPAHSSTPDQPVVKAANVIVRLADGATNWHLRDVRSDLGQWRDGYITIRGMWCEPLSHQRVNELNRRLAEAHRAKRQTQGVS